jgi:hypothetical protein
MPLPLAHGWVTATLVPQLNESRVEPREDRSFSELGKDPISLGQMLDGEAAISLSLVEKAEDHFSATDIMAFNIKLPNKPARRSTDERPAEARRLLHAQNINPNRRCDPSYARQKS